MAKSKWTTGNIPSQSGKTAIITGATSGLGKEAAKVLASKDAKVIMAVRNVEKGKVVAKEITQRYRNAQVDVQYLDLSKLQSVRDFAQSIDNTYGQIDILINNAGVMACRFAQTEDGFEIQMGVNHLGHFALTGLLS